MRKFLLFLHILTFITDTTPGEGATTSPGMFTSLFGRVKGETEAKLLELSKTTPSFKAYSARPAAVDPKFHPEIHDFMPARKGLLKVVEVVVLPPFRAAWPALISPTDKLGEALVDLAMGDGKPLEGKGISGEGRTINNVALRRLVGL